MAHIEKARLRQGYRNLWHADLLNTAEADPPFFCFAFWCGPCASYMLRRRALYNDMSRYVCCGGYLPCSGKCGERQCPEVCLGTEVCCCFGNSVASTRFMLQDEFNIQSTQCDNCIIGFMLCLDQVACIFSCIALILQSEELSEVSQMLNCLSDCVYSVVCTCMLTQHKIELDKRDGKFGPQVMAIPPVQQMSRIDQPYPPAVGYPPQGPQQAYGQPYGYPPPSNAQGYPPAGYPSPGYPPAGYPPSGYPSAGYPPSGYPPASYPPASYPPAGYYPPSGYPPAAYPPAGHSQADVKSTDQPPSAYPPADQPPSVSTPADQPQAPYPPPGQPPSVYPPAAADQPQASYPPAGQPPSAYPPPSQPSAGQSSSTHPPADQPSK